MDGAAILMPGRYYSGWFGGCRWIAASISASSKRAGYGEAIVGSWEGFRPVPRSYFFLYFHLVFLSSAPFPAQILKNTRINRSQIWPLFISVFHFFHPVFSRRARPICDASRLSFSFHGYKYLFLSFTSTISEIGDMPARSTVTTNGCFTNG